MASTQECVGGNHKPGVTVRDQRTGFSRIAGVSPLIKLTGNVQKSDMI